MKPFVAEIGINNYSSKYDTITDRSISFEEKEIEGVILHIDMNVVIFKDKSNKVTIVKSDKIDYILFKRYENE